MCLKEFYIKNAKVTEKDLAKLDNILESIWFLSKVDSNFIISRLSR